ncbi:hypothetical protein GRF29_19g2108628 [Pseudopithomyces chartarum]|uniref:Uncharacterized protein n=1 Tax=Pseudopithomyces chartarum TaxID=1892770 RepID=A0AAN6M539_9PLEO|nr:hypothetical protein GRF29_19g2108628 [Pseudopithomyces chartarum]
MTTAQAQLPIIAPRPAALQQRPKLRLDTHQVRTFGKGSSLRLDTLSAVSPTARNTFSNAYEPPAHPAPSRLRLSIDSSCKTPPSASTPSSASTLSSTLTSASADSATITIPYKQPHNLRSILTNGPAPLTSRKMASARPLFPAEKRVSFRTPLEEEIKTVKYTLSALQASAHAHLESSTSSLATTSSEDSEAPAATVLAINTKASGASVPSPLSPPTRSSSTFSSLESSPRPKGPRIGDKRDSSESDSDSCPETPVAGRRKRRRDWKWTLGPLPSDKATSSLSSSEATSEDSN